jgi:predicted O-methyltransferase YrrM
VDLSLKALSRRLSWQYKTKAASIAARSTKLFYALPEVDWPQHLETQPVLAPLLDDICLPPYFGATDHDDYTVLMSIAAVLQPTVVVELGTAYGNTVANISRHCPAAQIYTVNALADDQTGEMTTFALGRGEVGRVYRKYGLERRVIQIFSNTLTLDLSRYFSKSVVDLAIIDACHDTEYVLNDFRKVLPFLSERGVVMLHDTHPSMRAHLIASYRACMALRRTGSDIRHLRNTWWAIWLDWKRADHPLVAFWGRTRGNDRITGSLKLTGKETPQQL